MSAGGSVVKSIEVSDHHINIFPFHVFSASHESRLTASKPGRSQKCVGGRNFPELGGVQHTKMPAQRISPLPSDETWAVS